MSIDATKTFNLSVKKVEFFPYEWNENLLAVCLPNEVKIFSYNSPQVRKTKVNLQRNEIMVRPILLNSMISNQNKCLMKNYYNIL